MLRIAAALTLCEILALADDITDKDRAADLLIERYGEEAPIHAAMSADI